jgi:hypothetical protein
MTIQKILISSTRTCHALLPVWMELTLDC